jgi:hypothetical protein
MKRILLILLVAACSKPAPPTPEQKLAQLGQSFGTFAQRYSSRCRVQSSVGYFGGVEKEYLGKITGMVKDADTKRKVNVAFVPTGDTWVCRDEGSSVGLRGQEPPCAWLDAHCLLPNP